MNVINEIKQILQNINNDVDLSYGEIVFLQEHANEIKKYFPDDVHLWEMAGIPETYWNKKGQK